jgi:Zn-dependent protease with chaperone function
VNAPRLHLSRDVMRRERSHRRLTALAIVTLLGGSTLPLVADRLSSGMTSVLSGLDHVGTLCLIALHLILDPVQRGFDLLLATGIMWALLDRLRAWRRLRASVAPLVWRNPERGDPFAIAATAASLPSDRVRVTEGLPTPALTVGWWRPVVYVAREIAATLSAGELGAVLAHEATHVRRRDPLRMSVLRFVAVTLFWIPALRRLTDDVADEAEVVADDHAAASRPLVLASALLALARWPRPQGDMQGAVGFLHADLLERRVRRLAGEPTTVRSRLTWRSAASALGALAFVWSATIVAAHPLPFENTVSARQHCEHEHERPLAHLFCLGFPTAQHARCPHTS